MEFLPITLGGEGVYAGFLKRLWAGLVDALIILPLAFGLVWLEGLDRTLAIVITIPSSIMFAMYNVFFNARFGGTPGKLAVGIRVARPDGSRIDWPEAWKRSSVDVAFAAVVLTVQVWALTQVDSGLYASSPWLERQESLQEHWPAWYAPVGILQQVWIWSEIVVLLLNKRKRAVHDFIAGTVVIMKEFAEQGAADSRALRARR